MGGEDSRYSVGGTGSIVDDGVGKCCTPRYCHDPEADVPRYTLETIVVILVILWLLGAFILPLGGDLIHPLLVVVLVVVVVRLLQGRRML
jgi:hypothetical protein